MAAVDKIDVEKHQLLEEKKKLNHGISRAT